MSVAEIRILKLLRKRIEQQINTKGENKYRSCKIKENKLRWFICLML